jgi:hypothetical protein
MSGLRITVEVAPEVVQRVAPQIASVLVTLEDLASASQARADHPTLIDAAEVARRLGVTRDWVYENADRLGVVRLGGGRKPRLRFQPGEVEMAACSQGRKTLNGELAAKQAKRRSPLRSHTGTEVELLPIRGRNERQ